MDLLHPCKACVLLYFYHGIHLFIYLARNLDFLSINYINYIFVKTEVFQRHSTLFFFFPMLIKSIEESD